MRAEHNSGPESNRDNSEPAPVFETDHLGWTIAVYLLPTGSYLANARHSERVGVHAAVAGLPYDALELVRAMLAKYEQQLAELVFGELDETQPGGRHFIRRPAGEHEVPAELLEPKGGGQ